MDFSYDKDRIWLANEAGDVIAFVDFPEFEPGKVEVTHTVVDPSLRGQGVAGKLMEALAEQLEKEFKHKKEVRQRRIAAMKDAIKQAMITADLKQVDAGKFTIKLKKNGGLEPLIIDKPEEVPDNMKVIKYENDTKRIREYLADHPADWAHTEPRGSHIEIK